MKSDKVCVVDFCPGNRVFGSDYCKFHKQGKDCAAEGCEKPTGGGRWCSAECQAASHSDGAPQDDARDDDIVTSGPWKEGAYAALMRSARDCPNAGSRMAAQVNDWYAGFDAARGRLADLEAELIRGEEPK